MSAEDDDEARPVSRTATQDHAPDTTTTMPDTRRTSTSSAGGPSMQASQASMMSEGTRRQRPRPLDYGSTQSSTPNRLTTTMSPQGMGGAPSMTPRRPTSRRMPSSAAPHRGQAFSVDDDPDEVDKDLKLERTQSKSVVPQQRDRQLRRQQSTLRRRPTAAAQPPTLKTVESEERDEEVIVSGNDAAASAVPPQADGNGEPSSEETLHGEEEEEEQEEEEEPTTGEDDDDDESSNNDDSDDDDDADLSDAESFTLKDRQEAINETHPFGIRIWKPALYKKNRSVTRNAEGDIHSAPGGNVSRWLFVFNILWTLIFGWWLAFLAGIGGIINLVLYMTLGIESCHDYGRVLLNLAHYLFYPFGKYVELERDEAYLAEDEGEGRSITEYERWQTGDLEEGRLFFGPTDINRSIIGRRRDEVEDLDLPADETDSLLGPRRRGGGSLGRDAASPSSPGNNAHKSRAKKRLFGRGKWNLGRVVFFLSFYFLITPCLFLVSGVCWFLVFTIPMGKVTLLVFYHMRRHPLALSFHTDSHYARLGTTALGQRNNTTGNSAILLCTYRAVGLKYWKYTIDGTNIFLINLLGLVVFAILDYFVLYSALGIRNALTSPGVVFALALASIIPLAYFIGQAVASISAQSSMGVGATINAFFSTVVEVFLYCVALKQGKAQLVEGSIIGSIFAGILFLPGLSMCFGALKRKTQRFNVRSAGVTSTMLLFAVIGAFGPTLFYQIYGSHELKCHQCVVVDPEDGDCRRCFFAQVPAIAADDRFYVQAVRPYIWFASLLLFLSYGVGLLFTLRTHAAVIWNNEPEEKGREGGSNINKGDEGGRHPLAPDVVGGAARPGISRGETTGTVGSLAGGNVRESQMYKRILNQSLRQAGLQSLSGTVKRRDFVDAEDERAPTKSAADQQQQQQQQTQQIPFLIPPKTPAEGDSASAKSVRIHGLSVEDGRALMQQMAEMSATAATVAARDATRAPRKAQMMATTATTASGGHGRHHSKDGGGGKDGSIHEATPVDSTTKPSADDHAITPAPAAAPTGGHDAPNWSRTKSAVILLTATLAYAIIAEILVDTVDAVLTHIDLDEKFLGITLFALVPNTTEFLNAISFAMNGNVALSMEIGSSYALQVMLLQIPCLVLFSAVYGRYIDPQDVMDHTFSLIFPQWDMVTVILGVFLMGWVVGEGKSNYFKGSTLIFTYLVFIVGFWFSGFTDVDSRGVNRYDTLALGSRVETFRTIGRGKSGIAY
ncbi:hypothetical protein B0A55_05647 [Friedmanniomyces simplex]|uniref:Uncharacterized protein n=1 Tax=Friedmanniomyces simplex TaxID=329884 RepID=A0A4U0XD92_9PEZI|nr:hypothetical protein B0A55_05647 [Friedmanniomyces simplex]